MCYSRLKFSTARLAPQCTDVLYFMLISHLARAGTATGSGTRTNKSAVKSSLEWACPQRPDFIFRRHRLPISHFWSGYSGGCNAAESDAEHH